jgi:NAD-dependent deacetylase
MHDVRNIVILTGAGVSAESGLATFRGPDGLWEGHRVEDVATPEAFRRDPSLVHKFYDERRAHLAEVEPNAAHKALARLDAEWPGELLLITQNVDDLHERAGARRLIHMHGELLSALCRVCGARSPFADDMLDEPPCPTCGTPGALRPDIVFFGEIPYRMDEIQEALEQADLFVSIGTSGTVYPAAGFVQLARAAGADTLELNLEPSGGTASAGGYVAAGYGFAASLFGAATSLVPAWVDRLLAPR